MIFCFIFLQLKIVLKNFPSGNHETCNMYVYLDFSISNDFGMKADSGHEADNNIMCNADFNPLLPSLCRVTVWLPFRSIQH